MTKDEFAYWKAVTEGSRIRWTEDEIFRLNGRGCFYYTGGESGIYIKIHKDGKLEAGDYEDAFPHIGDAVFNPKVTRQCKDYNEAFTVAMESGGKKFLIDMFSSGPDTPLLEEKPSVLERIRSAQAAPHCQKDKPPRETLKNKGGPER
jgi:hypothetical protein